MNQYGDLPRRHWAHRLPEVYAGIRDPRTKTFPPTGGGRHEPGRREQPGLLLGALAAGYALPTIIALIRHVESIITVLILNLFPLAWPAALVMA